MKQWTEEDLILLYYQELDLVQTWEIRQDMAESSKESIALRRNYDALRKMLGSQLAIDVPAPRTDLNLTIMAAVKIAESEKRQAPIIRAIDTQEKTKHWGQKISHYLVGPPSNNFRLAFMFVLFAVVGIFYLGRWSASPVGLPTALLESSSETQQTYRPSAGASRRVLLTNVSSHIETSERLLRLISNSGNNLSSDLEPRRQMIENLISFNRLYRRLAEQSNDAMLANILQQMESILLEINHASDDDAEWDKVRSRLDGTDLLFKLKVADKKISLELT